ncbi:MAG: ATP-binding protein [Bacillaceae bacterium]|nr:ATP-binding protein [Bacillaceae bacterium]
MTTDSTKPIQKITIQTEDDLYLAISAARHLMNRLDFNKVDQQKVIVSISELCRNILNYSEHGTFLAEVTGNKLRLTFEDRGPGIEDLDEILNGRKSPLSKGLGMGLAGVKRLMDYFQIETSREGGGTKVIVEKWNTCENRKRRND